jgi:hypothetical protein
MTLMSRQATLTLTLAAGLALAASVAHAEGPGAGYGGEEIGTIRFLDRAASLVVLTDGDQFFAPDPRMLSNLKEGDRVKVDFTHDNDRSVLNFIEPAMPDTDDGAVPGSEMGPHEH